jgi:HPt (histidine-containing phosphotransfer) domain-containing protein
MRSLDALHLSAALALGDDASVFVAYDHRLANAAASIGSRALAPA